MTGLGLIATGLALKNFRDAKAEYNAAVANFNIEKTALILGINEYNARKYDDLEKYSERFLDPETGLPYNENDVVLGLNLIPILDVISIKDVNLRVVFGYRQTINLGISNTTNRAIIIRKIGGMMYCYGKYAGEIGDLNQTLEYIIKAHSSDIVNVNFGNSFNNAVEAQKAKEMGLDVKTFNRVFSKKEYSEQVLKAFQEAAGYTYEKIKGEIVNKNAKPLIPGTIIQSAAKIDGVKDSIYTNALTADVEIYYEDTLNHTVRRALYKDIQGYICYVG